jgi:hypothetical protein
MASIDSTTTALTHRVRPCARIGCNLAAVAAFTFDADVRIVWLDPVVEATRGAGLLCEPHAERLTPPRGWTLQDRRALAPSLWTERPTLRRAPTARRVARRERTARVRACSTSPTPLPFDTAQGAPSFVDSPRWEPHARPGPELDHALAARTPLLARAFEAARDPRPRREA